MQYKTAFFRLQTANLLFKNSPTFRERSVIMKFVVLFEDNPKAEDDLRTKYMPDHLTFLERHNGSIEAAGPLKTQAGSAAGGIWIVEASSADDVQTLVEQDPLWPTGLRKSVEILSWKHVFAGGRRLISV
jgi:uncharacterized protein YciI